MSYKHTAEKLADYRRQIRELRQKMRGVQAAVEPELVKDYTFRRADGGSVRLSELFGDKADLFVIHNMGQSCPYCTLWADGFNGAYAHLSNRASFVVSSPDTPERQRKFAKSRQWTFPMVWLAAEVQLRVRRGGIRPLRSRPLRLSRHIPPRGPSGLRARLQNREDEKT